MAGTADLRVIELQFEPADAPARRLRFLPSVEADEYVRIVEERDGDGWREVGHESVDWVECVVSA